MIKLERYMGTEEVRNKYLQFFKKRGHKIIPSASLVPEDDPTTLFTGSGMQPMLQYLLGKPHPLGTRITDSQKCFRSVDIEEVGDNRHTTIFEMLGNWSLGDYFKKEQLEWAWKFFIEELELKPERLYATVFRGYEDIPKDEEAVQILKHIYRNYGIEAKAVDNAEKNGMQGGRIFYYPAEENWWSRVGVPDDMPTGEPGGPTAEVFYDFGGQLEIHEKSPYKNNPCHLNCDCGRFLEIGNSVFMTYKKQNDGSLKELPQKNIDFGGGLERIVTATQDTPDVFLIDSFKALIKTIEKVTGLEYKEENKAPMRIIADHLKGAAFLISDDVLPSNKDCGYFLRRILRRAAANFYKLTGDAAPVEEVKEVTSQVIDFYGDLYFEPVKDSQKINKIIEEELEKFNRALIRGIKYVKQADKEQINAKFVFDLYQSQGLPFAVTREILAKRGISVDKKEFEKEYEKHQKVSRRGAKKKFRGGLADQNKETVKLHTATHLLHKALREVLGDHVKQQGSNITADRLRFDFSHPKALTEEELEKLKKIVNEKIEKDLKVWSEIMSKKDAEEIGALAFFREKYPSKVSVYFIGEDKDKPEKAYSKEFCGGPHVSSTGELGVFRIDKEKSAGSGIRRIYAKLE